MSPEQVINVLSQRLGVNITRRTLLNYEKWGLVKPPVRGGGGTGGKWAEYSNEILMEIYATWKLLHGEYGDENLKALFGGNLPKLSPNAVQQIRTVSCELESQHKKEINDYLYANANNDNIIGQEIIEAENNFSQNQFSDIQKKCVEQFGSVGVTYSHMLYAFITAWNHEKIAAMALLIDSKNKNAE